MLSAPRTWRVEQYIDGGWSTVEHGLTHVEARSMYNELDPAYSKRMLDNGEPRMTVVVARDHVNISMADCIARR